MNYYFNVSDQILTCTNTRRTIISDSVNVHIAKFKFDSMWDGFGKTATFTNSKTGIAINMVMGTTLTECTIPWESLVADKEGGYLIVCVQGVKDDKKMYTRMDMSFPLLILLSDETNGTNPQPPTQSVYDQIMDLIEGVGTNYIAGDNISIANDTISSNQINDLLTTSLVKTWSIDKLKAMFQPKAYELKLYGTKTGTLAVDLTDAKPTISATNYIETIATSNITIDWINGTNITFTRTSTSPIKLSNKDSTIFNLLVAFNRDCSVEYGAIAYADGVPITSPQTFGNQDFSGVSGFTTVQPLKYELEFDLLASETTFPVGTVFTTKLFKRQETASPTLTTRYLFGVNTNGINRISYSKVETTV